MSWHWCFLRTDALNNFFSFGFLVLLAKGSPAEIGGLCCTQRLHHCHGCPCREKGETFYCRTEGEWTDSQKGKMCGLSKLWSGRAERTGRVCTLTQDGGFHGQSCAGKPQEKKEVHHPVLLEFWALERPKEHFNTSCSWFWNSLEQEKKIFKTYNRKVIFYPFASEVWNWRSWRQTASACSKGVRKIHG